MGRYTVIPLPKALKHLSQIKRSGDKALQRKVEQLLEELAEHPTTGTGQPEQLRGLPDTWSRRLDRKNRLVYAVEEEVVKVLVVSLLGHYDDK